MLPLPWTLAPDPHLRAFGNLQSADKVVRYFPQSWLAQGFSANRSRGDAQFVIQCGQWQHSALREF